ncbi:MAG: NINE protein [Sphaerochaetaceae bacterium]|nr:NINE protein [Sphaerochaetaceae bacterium]
MKECPHCGVANSDDRNTCVVCKNDISNVKKNSYTKKKYTVEYDGDITSLSHNKDKGKENNSKNRITAGVFAIILGTFGVHRFYLNKIGAGIINFLFCWTGIATIIGIVEGVIMLTQSDEDFRKQQNLLSVVNTKNKSNTNNISELRALKELYDENVITEEEFQAKKKQLLN